MRRSLAVILSTATLGTMVAATGCAEHRYRTNDPYYNSPYYGYNGWDAAEQARYREWLAERRYEYLEFNRLSAERQREYWAWRNSHYPRSVQDQYRNYNRERIRERNEHDHDFRNDHDRDARDGRNDRDRRYVRGDDRDRDNRQYDRDRDNRQQARERDGQDRRYTRDRDDRNRPNQNHARDKDHDGKRGDHDRDKDHDHR
jgi:hypothetical protein